MNLSFGLSPASTVCGVKLTPSGPAYDSDAVAFFTAAGITNTNQKNAVNTLVTGMKSAGIWTLMTAIYPIVGATALAHSKNLRNPATHSVTWVNSPTHAQSGFAPGATGYGSVPPAIWSASVVTNVSIGAVNATLTTPPSTSCWIGTRKATGGGPRAYFNQYNGNYTEAEIGSSSYDSGTPAGAGGMIHVYRTGSVTTLRYNNTELDGTPASSAAGALPDTELLLGALNTSETPGSVTASNVSTTAVITFAFVGQYLTPTQANDFYTLITAYNSARGTF